MIANERLRCVKQLRSETRMKVLLSAELTVRGDRVACRIHDISRGGACLESEQPGRVGETIRLDRGSLAASGRISWVRGRRFGIMFDAPIRATELLVQMSHSRQASAGAEARLEQPSAKVRIAAISPSM